ncbi:hypothetical protein, partial [Hyella patelloides]|uniref:hypothetical protein n=1 Tax=Hyella patelloides TaxID=1982969 RepID=UPI001C9507A5
PWVSLNEQYARCEASPLGERYPLGLVQDSNVTQNNTVRSYKLSCYKLSCFEIILDNSIESVKTCLSIMHSPTP